jgi:hypothetical protein
VPAVPVCLGTEARPSTVRGHKLGPVAAAQQRTTTLTRCGWRSTWPLSAPGALRPAELLNRQRRMLTDHGYPAVLAEISPGTSRGRPGPATC